MTDINGYDKWKTTPPEQPEPDPPDEPQITEEEYVAENGAVCPWCLSGDLDWGPLEAEAQGAIQYVDCNACEKRWLDRHELKGFMEIIM